MKGVNKATIVGTFGKDPEVRYLASGDAVASFSVATSEKWKDKQTGEMREETEWHRMTAFGKLAEIIGEYARKGSKVYCEGQIKTRKYQDKQTGQDRYATEIKVNDFQLLDSKPAGEQSERPAQRAAAPAAAPTDEFIDDIPF